MVPVPTTHVNTYTNTTTPHPAHTFTLSPSPPHLSPSPTTHHRPQTPTYHRPQTPTHLDVPHGAILISVRCNDNIERLDNALECLVEVFLLQLQLQQGSVHLVHKTYRLDPLSNGLAKHCLCLYTYSCKRKEKKENDRGWRGREGGRKEELIDKKEEEEEQEEE